MKRSILAAMVVTGLAGCGEDTFEAPPDCSGRFLAVYARQTAIDQADVYLYDYEGLGFHLLPNLNSTNEQDLDPALTRDIRFVAFERVLSPANTDILFYDRCQAALLSQPGLNTQQSETDPAFTGDGSKLAFVRDTLGGRQVRVYDGALDQLVPLPGLATGSVYLDADPAPNQDGSRIAFASNRSGTFDILVYDATGDSLMSLPDLASAGRDVDPSLTPDGRYLIFSSDRLLADDYDLYLYDLQTKAFLTLGPGVNTTFSERHPSINYSTDRIAFESNRTGTQGGLDIFLYTRSSGSVSASGPSSPVIDRTPYIVWQ